MNSKILITIHGWCFVGGSASYDEEQTAFLKTFFDKVYQIDFIKTKLSETLIDIESQIKKIKEFHKNSDYIVLGRSSGGYIAKVLFDKGLFHKAIYLCPVFNPILRGNKIKHLGIKAHSYFTDEYIYDTNKWNNDCECLFLVDNDEKCTKRMLYRRTNKK